MASGPIRARWFDRVEKPDWAPPNWGDGVPLHCTVTDMDVGAVPHIFPWPLTATGNTSVGRCYWGDGLSTLVMWDHIPGMGLPIAHQYIVPGTWEITVKFGSGVSGTPSLDAVRSYEWRQKVTVTEPEPEP